MPSMMKTALLFCYGLLFVLLDLFFQEEPYRKLCFNSTKTLAGNVLGLENDFILQSRALNKRDSLIKKLTLQ